VLSAGSDRGGVDNEKKGDARMKTIILAGLICAVGMAGSAMAGSLDSPGPSSEGSGMPTLKQVYEYLTVGSPVTIAGSFEGPTAGPGSTMYTTKQIYEAVATPFPQCDATVSDVKAGKKFFSTQSGSWGVQTGTMSTVAGLLKTGQTTSYYTGDDGYYQKGTAFSYTDNGDGTVTDNVTSLMWAKDGNAAGCRSGAPVYWSSAIEWAEGLVFAGYSDWRLPNRGELLSLNQITSSSPYINKTFFPNTSSTAYWSSTTQIGSTGRAYACPYTNSSLVVDTWPYGGYMGAVRAVRGGSN
jgi:hypothetical protein